MAGPAISGWRLSDSDAQALRSGGLQGGLANLRSQVEAARHKGEL